MDKILREIGIPLAVQEQFKQQNINWSTFARINST